MSEQDDTCVTCKQPILPDQSACKNAQDEWMHADMWECLEALAIATGTWKPKPPAQPDKGASKAADKTT
jgi:hypothetical protein